MKIFFTECRVKANESVFLVKEKRGSDVVQNHNGYMKNIKVENYEKKRLILNMSSWPLIVWSG